MSNKHYEDNLSMAVASLLTTAQPGCLWWHTPNGGVRNKAEAGRFKKMGVKAGTPDYIFILPDNTVGFIELKLGKSPYHTKTYQSADQKKFQADYEDLTYHKNRYVVCRSTIEVCEALDSWGIKWTYRYGKRIKIA